ncbi:MAG: PTS sugar transporter subunit IIA [Eggerthellaceae bacterium]|nr:PTS sugar transporter subunit IIA [Eggerthellaceae bacterium]
MQSSHAVIVSDGIMLGQTDKTKEAAIKAAGKLIVELGLADQNYADSMLEREKTVSTYMGMGVAILHSISKAKEHAKDRDLVFAVSKRCRFWRGRCPACFLHFLSWCRTSRDAFINFQIY